MILLHFILLKCVFSWKASANVKTIRCRGDAFSPRNYTSLWFVPILSQELYFFLARNGYYLFSPRNYTSQKIIGEYVVSCSFMQILSITIQGPLNFTRKNDLETNNFHAPHAIVVTLDSFILRPSFRTMRLKNEPRGNSKSCYAQRQLQSPFGKLPFANGMFANGAF